jgi:hypothetical protein
MTDTKIGRVMLLRRGKDERRTKPKSGAHGSPQLMSLPLPSVILAAAPAVTASCPLPPVIVSSGPATTTSAPLPAWIVDLPAIRSPRVPAAPHRFDPSPDLAEENTLTIPPDLEAQILRYYHVEKWHVGTIARQLHVHHGTVTRVLAQAASGSAR